MYIELSEKLFSSKSRLKFQIWKIKSGACHITRALIGRFEETNFGASETVDAAQILSPRPWPTFFRVIRISPISFSPVALFFSMGILGERKMTNSE